MNERQYAPIIITVYNRLYTLKKCIKSLLENDMSIESDLYVISDAAFRKEDEEKIIEIREYIKKIEGFKSVNLIARAHNMGAHDSCYDGITQVLQKYETFIFLEDDIVVSKDFLQYLNAGLTYYKDDDYIYSISAFSLPFKIPSSYKKEIWFSPSYSPWGYATWKEKFEKVDFGFYDRYSELKKDKKEYSKFMSIGFYVKGILRDDSKGKIEAGDVRVYYHMFQHRMSSVFPITSKSQNIGFDGSGEHCDNSNAWWAKPELNKQNKPTVFEPFVDYNEDILKASRKFLDKIYGGIVAKYLKYTWIHDLYKKIK
jgi:Predicted glycosyltransferases